MLDTAWRDRAPPTRAYAARVAQSPTLRESIKQAFPQLVHVGRLVRLLKNQARFPIAATILDWQGRIQAGPFAGLRFPRSGCGDFSAMLGTYEFSLIPLLEEAIARQPDVIINPGAAWGYYAMGLAYRCPNAAVIAYEMDRTRFDLMRKYVRINKLRDRIAMAGECTLATLASDLEGSERPFICMDVEGAEKMLLQPDLPNIAKTEILVELHEVFVPGITDLLKNRFAPTHTITVVGQADLTNHAPPPGTGGFVRRCWAGLIKEERTHPMTWMHLVPRSS